MLHLRTFHSHRSCLRIYFSDGEARNERFPTNMVDFSVHPVQCSCQPRVRTTIIDPNDDSQSLQSPAGNIIVLAAQKWESEINDPKHSSKIQLVNTPITIVSVCSARDRTLHAERKVGLCKNNRLSFSPSSFHSVSFTTTSAEADSTCLSLACLLSIVDPWKLLDAICRHHLSYHLLRSLQSFQNPDTRRRLLFNSGYDAFAFWLDGMTTTSVSQNLAGLVEPRVTKTRGVELYLAFVSQN